MKKFFIKIIVLTLPFIILLFMPQQKDDSFKERIKMLQECGHPKLVIIGDSNAGMGIDSAEISKALGMPVRNLGVSGSTIAVVTDMIMGSLYKGDTVVFSSVYSVFTENWNGNSNMWHLIFNSKRYDLLYNQRYYGPPKGLLLYINTRIINNLKFLISLMQKKTNNVKAGEAESEPYFNEYGDSVGYYNTMGAIPNFKSIRNIGVINKTYIKYFFNIVEDLNKKGVRVLVSYPSYEEASFNASEDVIYELDKTFRENKDLTVISNPRDYSFPRAYCYDTPYHLNPEGKEIRTQRLIKDLRSAGL